ncbi:MAG: hypothetical protein L0Z68_04125 [Gammaproteobacteria bacterium]|nr:hypothetical protein [Gammaproteobacteria bacterium]
MSHSHWCSRIAANFPWVGREDKILGLLVSLAAIGLIHDGWETAFQLWQEYRRPVAFYRHGIDNGLAISLNGLEQGRQEIGSRLPGLHLRGVLFDRKHNDWVLFGEADPKRPGIPLDAMTIAARATRLYLEAPGVDIRPRRRGEGEQQAVQEISYFGGTAQTIVGAWFFQFDYWMKRTSLGKEAALIPGIPVYWRRAVEALEQEIKVCDGTRQGEWTHHNRYWLCASDFKAIEGDDTLTFESTPLQVFTEELETARGTTASPALPCASRGSDDPVAAEFASWLTEHLAELARVVPVSEIEDFARLLAGLAWLVEQDPYRDLGPWLNATVVTTETPMSVPSLAMRAMRQHTLTLRGTYAVHRHSIELSGGVLVSPSLAPARVGDNSLLFLHHAVLTARPVGRAVLWGFTFSPPLM